MHGDIGLGKLIEGTQHRDAVHIAVAPVIAGDDLKPGQHVGFNVESGTASADTEHIGIVDPFLLASVQRNQKFWLFLYPGTITSLRHDWTHPAFNTSDNKSESRRWIKEYAASFNMTYPQVMDAAAKMDEYGDYTYDNSEYYKDGRYYSDIAEFWKHYEIITGKKVEDHKTTFFDCSC